LIWLIVVRDQLLVEASGGFVLIPGLLLEKECEEMAIGPIVLKRSVVFLTLNANFPEK